MFNWRVNVVLLALFGLISLASGRLFYITESDREAYAELLRSSEPETSEEEKESHTAKQQRGAVHKEIWFAENGSRLYSSLRSERSELMVSDSGEEREMVEKLIAVRSYMQEELFYQLEDGREAVRQANGQLLLRRADPGLALSWVDPKKEHLKAMQVIRFLEAEEGEYYYSTNRFIANEVNVLRFIADGHELVEDVTEHTLIMRGVAKSIELNFNGRNINFEAHHLKATFFTTRGMM